MDLNNALNIYDQIYKFAQTPQGAILIRVLPALIGGIALRLIAWEIFGAIDSFLKDKNSKAFQRLAVGIGYISNIGLSIFLATLFKNGYSGKVLIAWGVLYGCASIVCQVAWDLFYFNWLKKKLKKKYNIEVKLP